MKKFLIRIAKFVVPVIILIYPLDYVMSHLLMKSHRVPGEIEVWNDIYHGQINADVAVYGSSRAWQQFDSQLIGDSLNEPTYNFGIDGHNFWLQYLRHIEYFKYNRKPKTIILSVDVFTLQKRPDLYQLNQFLPFMLWNNDIYDFTHSYEGFNFFDYYVPLVRYSGQVKSFYEMALPIIKKEKVSDFRKKGYHAFNDKWNSDFDKAKATMEKYEIKWDSKSIDLFEQFIGECKDEGIRLILVFAPEYIEGQQFVSNRSTLVSYYEEIAGKYNLPFFNFSNDPICYDKDNFYNSEHMNRTGSLKFSKELSHKILTYWNENK